MRLLLVALTALLLFGSSAVTPVAPSASAQEGAKARLDVTNITPSVVDGQGEVTVTGTLTNTSDYELSGVEGRIERGAVVESEAAAREAVQGQSARATQPEFAPITDHLAPGERTPVEFRVPLSGAPNSLQISQPGSYPLVFNINATPSYGNRERVAEASTVLPVVSAPGSEARKPQRPLSTSVLLPIVDYPSLVDTEGGTPVLADDHLEKSLTQGGRLAELVQAVGDELGQGAPLADSACFAVDPDLLITVEAMRDSYRVRQPDGGTRAGTASDAAKAWLEKLREVTSGRCVTVLPIADVDVVALGRADLPDLISGSLDARSRVRQVLGVEPRSDLFWPIDGAMDEPAATTLSNLGIDTILTRPNALGDQPNPLQPSRLNTKGSPTAMPIDPLVSDALDPVNERGTAGALAPADNGLLSVQDALGSLAFRATLGRTPESVSVIAPPRRWNLRGDELRALLSGMETLRKAGYLNPTQIRPTPDPAAPQVDLAYPMSSATNEITQPLLDELAKQNFKVGDLYRSSSKDPAANVDRAAVTTPLRNGLLRGASSAWRGDPARAWEWLDEGTTRIEDVLSSIQVDIPKTPVTLSGSNSFIPVKVSNGLPLTVRVVLRTPPTAGIKIRDLGVLSVPQGARSFLPQAEAQRAGRFTVDITATTEAGTKLGSSKRLQVESSNYGPLAIILTAAAAGMLVIMSTARIIRRIRRGTRPPKAAGGGEGTN